MVWRARRLRVACFTVGKGRPLQVVVVVGADTEVGEQLVADWGAVNNGPMLRSVNADAAVLQPEATSFGAPLVPSQDLLSACFDADVIVWCEPEGDQVQALKDVTWQNPRQPPLVILFTSRSTSEFGDVIPCRVLSPKLAFGQMSPILEMDQVTKALMNVAQGSPLPPDSHFTLSQLPEPSGSSVPRSVRLAVLLSVPLAWGTYTPAVRYMYTLPDPVPSLLFASMYHVFAFGGLLIPILYSRWRGTGGQSDVPPTDILKAGAELGGYKFLGNCALLFGLRLTTSGVASFITQLSTVIIPIMEAFVWRRPVPGVTWLACLLSLGGVAVFAGDSLTSGAAAGAAALQGHALALLAAFFYSLQILRLGKWAPCTKATSLAITKVFFELLYNSLLITALVVSGSPLGKDMLEFTQMAFSGGIAWESWKAILGAAAWVGGVSCGYTMWAQSFGQRTVRPVNANLIYASQPIWSALIGVVLLGESFGRFGFLGAALIGSGVLLSILIQRREAARLEREEAAAASAGETARSA
eukprot:EG_transcript_7830